jgi:hypothetical protein
MVKATERKKRTPKQPVSDAVRLLRFIQSANPPTCCGQEMHARFLNCGDIHNDDLDSLREQEYADYLIENAPLAPYWSCDKCDSEKQIDGLEWPIFKPQETSETKPAAKPKGNGSEFSFCPHCGHKLPSNSTG